MWALYLIYRQPISFGEQGVAYPHLKWSYLGNNIGKMLTVEDFFFLIHYVMQILNRWRYTSLRRLKACSSHIVKFLFTPSEFKLPCMTVYIPVVCSMESSIMTGSISTNLVLLNFLFLLIQLLIPLNQLKVKSFQINIYQNKPVTT